MTPDIWKVSPPVPVLERPPKPERALASSPELTRIKSALDAIPNSGQQELDYDNWFSIIAAIHQATDGGDEGLSLAHDFSARSQKYDADFLDNRVWPYLRSDRDGALHTAARIAREAELHGWQDPSIADDFEVIEGVAERAAGELGRFAPVQAAAFAARHPARWLVKGVLPQAELVVIYGESGSGKSFWTLDVTAAIARGEPWRGARTTAGRVIYIAAEGAGGFRKRLEAYARQQEIALEDLDLFVIADAPRFTEAADIKALVAAVRPLNPSVIVVDTLARAMAGADENSAEDMGLAITHCSTLHKVTGATVVLIHHSGKTLGKGARGHSSLKAAADAEIEIVRFEDDRVALISKQKDGEDGAEFGFKLAQVPVGMDDDGDVITSCVVEHTEAPPKRERKREPKGAKERLVLRVAQDLIGLDGTPPKVTEVIDEVVNQTPHDATEGKRDRRREVALRALDALVEANHVRVEGGAVCIT